MIEKIKILADYMQGNPLADKLARGIEGGLWTVAILLGVLVFLIILRYILKWYEEKKYHYSW